MRRCVFVYFHILISLFFFSFDTFAGKTICLDIEKVECS
jgi:hypothetical protein